MTGCETHRFRPFVDHCWDTAKAAGHSRDQLRVGVHSLDYVAETTKETIDDFFPGYARAFTDIGKERGWGPISRADFEAQRTPEGPLLVGNPEEVAEKIIRLSKSLGGISRITFLMNAASIPHTKFLRAIDLISTRVAPAVRSLLPSS